MSDYEINTCGSSQPTDAASKLISKVPVYLDVSTLLLEDANAQWPEWKSVEYGGRQFMYSPSTIHALEVLPIELIWLSSMDVEAILPIIGLEGREYEIYRQESDDSAWKAEIIEQRLEKDSLPFIWIGHDLMVRGQWALRNLVENPGLVEFALVRTNEYGGITNHTMSDVVNFLETLPIEGYQIET